MELPTRPPKKPTTKLPPAPPKGNKQNKVAKKVTKTFTTKAWDSSAEGEGIILYGDSGMGKTTLAAMSPKPVFVALDRGSSKIKHPVTGKPLNYIPGIETFDDFRDVLHQTDLFNDYETIVIDTATLIEPIALAWTLENIPHEKGCTITGIESYGYGKGYRHVYDTMRLPLADYDALIHAGKNVLILCQKDQIDESNSGGEDFKCDVPKLPKEHGQTPAVWPLYCEWADHILKIDYESISAKDGKAIASNSRVIRVHPEAHFKAKSRTISPEYPVVTFDSPADDSIWRFIWPDKHEEA